MIDEMLEKEGRNRMKNCLGSIPKVKKTESCRRTVGELELSVNRNKKEMKNKEPVNDSWNEQVEEDELNLSEKVDKIQMDLTANQNDDNDQEELFKAADMTGIRQLSQLMKIAISDSIRKTMTDQVAKMIKQAVEEAIIPLHAKIDQLNQKLDSQINNMGNDQFPVLPVQRTRLMSNHLPIWPRQQAQAGSIRPQMNIQQDNKMREETEEKEAFTMARRCIGLFPLTSDDIDQQHPSADAGSRNNDSFQKAGISAARIYFTNILKMSSTAAENLDIVGVFYQGKGAASNTLYVELNHQNDMALIRNAAVNMKNTENSKPQLIQFIPPILKSKYNMVQNLAYEGRTENAVRKASKIWIKSQNFELRFKEKDDPTPWAAIIPVDIPAMIAAKNLPKPITAHSRPIAKLTGANLTPIPSHTEPENRIRLHAEPENRIQPFRATIYNLPTSNKFTVIDPDLYNTLH